MTGINFSINLKLLITKETKIKTYSVILIERLIGFFLRSKCFLDLTLIVVSNQLQTNYFSKYVALNPAWNKVIVFEVLMPSAQIQDSSITWTFCDSNHLFGYLVKDITKALIETLLLDYF